RGGRFRVLPAEHWHPRAPGLIPVPMTADAVDVARREAGVGQCALDRLRGDFLRRVARGLRVVGLADPDDRHLARDVLERGGEPPVRRAQVPRRALSACVTVAAVWPKRTFRASSSSVPLRRSSSPTARPFLTAGRAATASHQRATCGKSASTLRPWYSGNTQHQVAMSAIE